MKSFDTIIAVLQDRVDSPCKGLPSEAVVAGRLLGAQNRLADAFYEISTKLQTHAQVRTLLDLVMTAASPWSLRLDPLVAPKQMELLHLNRQVARAAALLGGLMLRRAEMKNEHGAEHQLLFWPADVFRVGFDRAGKHNGVAAGVQLLSEQFDTTCWPSMTDLCKVVRVEAEEAPVPMDRPGDAVTELAAEEQVRRFLNALMNGMLMGNGHVDLLPEDLELSDATLAVLSNTALDLAPDQWIKAADVRGLRPWIYFHEEEPEP